MSEAHASFPRRISGGLRHPEHVYHIVDGYFAIRGPVSGNSALSCVANLADDLAIYRGNPPDAVSSDKRLTVSPVYALSSDGPLAVPTGRIFLRFQESVDIQMQREAITRFGYSLTEPLAYAPYSGWVVRSNGRMDEALALMETLFHLPDISNVEPEMLSKRVAR